MNKKIIAALCMIFITTSLVGCSNVSDIASVTVTKVKTSSSISDTTYTGTVSSADQVSIIPSVSGKIDAINVAVGQKVKKGDILFTIDKTDLVYKVNQAQASYDAAVMAYDKANNGSAAQTQNDANTAIEKAQNELKDATNAYNIAKNQYDNNTNIVSAQTTYDDAKANYDRTKTLYDAGVATKVDLDTAKSKLDSSTAALEMAKSSAQVSLSSAENRLNNAKATLNSVTQNASLNNAVLNPKTIAAAKAQMDSAKATLDLAQHQLDNADVTAPVDGKVSAKNIAVGDLTPTQAASIVLDNVSSINAVIKVTETNINNVSLGMEAKIIIPATGYSYDGNVSTIATSADQKTGTFEVKVTITNPDDKLRLGMVANAILVNPNEKEILSVPNNSVFKDGGTSYVYIINGDKLSKHNVTVGRTKNQYVEINEGLTKDNDVVVQGSANMKDNEKVNIIKSN